MGHTPKQHAAAMHFDISAIREGIATLLRKQIFFVGGSEKSGTSWLQRLLDLHPQVSCGGEVHFNSLFVKIKNALDEHNQFLLDKAHNAFLHQIGATKPVFELGDLAYILASAISVFLLKQTRGKSVRAVGERTPANVLAFGGFLELFPGAKCIHIVRDPRDAGVSSWHHTRRFVATEARSQMMPLRDFVLQYVEIWAQTVGRGVEFAAANPERYFELRFEDLVEQTPPTLARIFRFLGVDDSKEVAERCASAASFEQLSGGRMRGEENLDSFFRKGVVGDWRNHLDSETNNNVVARAGVLMRRFDYL